MDKEILKVPATIEKIITMKDKSLRLFIDTQELTSEDKGRIMAMHEQIGVFVFVPQEKQLKSEDLGDLPEFKIDKDEKSPSQQLRARMFVFYKEKNQTKEGFFQWYSSQLETFGQRYLDKLN